MNTLVLFALLFFCMAIGMPIAISLGLSSIVTIVFFSQDSLASLTIKMFETSEHYTLMSIPFFVLAGVLMSTGGVARRMVNFATCAVVWPLPRCWPACCLQRCRVRARRRWWPLAPS